MKRTYIPNEYDGEAWVLIDVLGVVTKGYGNFKCRMLSIVVDFMILSDTYCFLFWVGRWYLLSTCVLYWPLLVCFPFVHCGVQQTYHRLQFNRNSSQSSSRQISGWAIVSSLDWIFFFMSWCLEVPAWTSFLFILAFQILLALVIWGQMFLWWWLPDFGE